jgi:hypothetical protein
LIEKLPCIAPSRYFCPDRVKWLDVGGSGASERPTKRRREIDMPTGTEIWKTAARIDIHN